MITPIVNPERCASPEIIKFYNSDKWRSLSKRVLKLNPLWQRCLELNVIEPAAHADHIIEIKDCWDKRLDTENLQALCALS